MESRREGLKFLADNMLGRLARYMRIMGFDTLYPNLEVPDSFLIHLSLEEDRILLSRDKELNRRWKNSIFINSDRLDAQIKQVAEKFKPDFNRLFSRCTVCNGILTGVKTPCKEEYYKEEIDSVKQCESCGKCYWRGTHVSNMIKYLENLGIYNES